MFDPVCLASVGSSALAFILSGLFDSRISAFLYNNDNKLMIIKVTVKVLDFSVYPSVEGGEKLFCDLLKLQWRSFQEEETMLSEVRVGV